MEHLNDNIIANAKKNRTKKIRKSLLVTISIIVFVIASLIVFISPISKYLIEKYDTKYTGREITIDWVYINPFTGYMHLSNLKVYEYRNKNIFFAANSLNANIVMYKLLYKTYEISHLYIDNPRGIVIQNKKQFNFDDLLQQFSPKKDTTKKHSPAHFNILSIKIINGTFYYQDKVIPVNYFIKNVNIESSGMRWNVDTVAAQFSFVSGIGSGKVDGNVTSNIKNKNYRLAIRIKKFDLNIIEQYLNDLTNYGNFSAVLDANMKATGNYIDKEAISTAGEIEINDFHFGKNLKDDYASFEKLVIKINEMTPKKHIYLYDSISLKHPYIKYEKYDYLDNLQTIFGKEGSNVTAANANNDQFNLIIEVANYIKIISKNFFKSDYKINRLAIYNGDIHFNDYTNSEKFSIALNPLYVLSDSIDKKRNRVNIHLKSGIKPYGNSLINLSINPKDNEDFDIQYQFQKMPVAMFNPYIIKYTSFPLNRGTLELKGKWNVKNGVIKSNNHLIVIDPRSGERLKRKDSKWVPLPLIMYFIRERGNVIDYEIPISGDLKNPKFHFKDILFDVVENIFVKPPTTAYQIKVKKTETEIEKSLSLNWEMRSATFSSKQEKFIEKIVDFLKDNPDATINVSPQQYGIKEKEYILFFETKKKYYMEINNVKGGVLTQNDLIRIDKMSVKDSLFINYLNKKKNNASLFTIQEKCYAIVDSSKVNAVFENLNKERKKLFSAYFIKKGVEKQVNILSQKNVIPYNGFSFYKIEYKGEFPESLLKAYQKMSELNDMAPRDKFKKHRVKS